MHRARAKEADIGKIYCQQEDHGTLVKLRDPGNRVMEYKVQIYSDGFFNFYYGIDYHGRALYYENGRWISYTEISDRRFPDFVEKQETS